jgi:hypothetical protein
VTSGVVGSGVVVSGGGAVVDGWVAGSVDGWVVVAGVLAVVGGRDSVVPSDVEVVPVPERVDGAVAGVVVSPG